MLPQLLIYWAKLGLKIFLDEWAMGFSDFGIIENTKWESQRLLKKTVTKSNPWKKYFNGYKNKNIFSTKLRKWKWNQWNGKKRKNKNKEDTLQCCWSMKSLRKSLWFPLQPITTLSIAFNTYQLNHRKLYVLKTDPK